MNFEAKDVCAGYADVDIVRDVSFTLRSGEVLCLLGPNGVGKTTLFKSLLGFLPLHGGNISLDGKPLCFSDYKRQAALIGYVPQVHEPPFPFQVLDVVVMGSIVRMNYFSGPSHGEYSKAEEILEMLGVSYLSNKVYTEISGGERQMVLIARALMQEPKFLMMDEPTSNLDFGNQMRVLQQVQMLAEQGMGIIMTSHFPDHAFLCCNKAAVMCKDTSFKVGSVQDIVTEDVLHKAYGIRVKIAYVDTSEENSDMVRTCVPIMHKINLSRKEIV
ncbi:ABC transporter ATP-binding protein [Anaerovorax odorimutans]|uniref:ABC transporter ATP-binding protein n=1 Tax=Anaerovorax odorimutans TaxID=109327 RepID=UPI00041DC99B|nr:ABC transporter ATP-binding protein [Anaerovorax odorimutans]